MSKRKAERTPQMFTKDIGDKIALDYSKKVNEVIRQNNLTLLEKFNEKLDLYRRKILQTLTQNNKNNENKQQNMEMFIGDTVVHMIKESKVLFTQKHFDEVAKDLKRVNDNYAALKDDEERLEERKLAKRAYSFYDELKGKSANEKLLSWFTRNYSTHIDQVIRYDRKNPNSESMVELFNKTIKHHLPALYTRVLTIELERRH